MNSRDLLYNIVPIVNDNVYMKFVRRIDVMLSVLITITLKVILKEC